MDSPYQPLQIPPVYAYFAKMMPSTKFILSSREAASFKILPSVPLVRLTDRNDCSAWAEVYYFERGKNLEQLYPEAKERIGVILRSYHHWKIELWRRLQEKILEERRKRKQEQEGEGEREDEMKTEEELEEEEFRRQEPERKALDQWLWEERKMKDQEEQRKLKEEGKVTIKQEPKEE